MEARIIMYKSLILSVLVLVLSTFADAAEQKRKLPSLNSTTMTVPWDDFRRLWEAATIAQKKDDVKEEKKKLPPPVPWSVSAAEFTGEATGEGSIRFQGTLQLTVLDEREWSHIPILGNEAAPIGVTLNGDPYGLTLTKEGWHGLVIEEPGDYEVTIEFYTPTLEVDGEVSFGFGIPRVPITGLKLRIPDSKAIVAAPFAAVVSMEKDDTGLDAELAFLAGDSITLSWTKPAPIVVDEAIEEVETRISAVVSTLTTVSDQFILCNSNVQFDVLRGETNEFQFDLPNGVNIIDVAGQGIAWSTQESESSQTVEVSINHDIEDSFAFDVQYELPLDKEFGTVRVPLLRLVNIARETGYLAVAATANVELGPGPEILDLTRLDNRELPSLLKSRSTNPILLAFKYPSGNPSLTLDIRKLEDEPVRGASIERAVLSTMVTEQGYRITRAHYDVRNNIKQFLNLSIDGDIDIWNAEVGGLPVKPARDSESDAILIPLFKSTVKQRALETFPVEVLYMQKIGDQDTIDDTLSFTAPVTDIPIGKLFWNVLLPPKKEIAESSGDLERLEPTQSNYDTVDLSESGLRPVVRRNREELWALREGVERFLITDINNPGASAAGQSGHGFDGAGEGGGGAPATLNPRREGVELAGLLPMRADFDMEGSPNLFKRLIVPAGTPMSITIGLQDREEPPRHLRERIGVLSALAGIFPIALALIRFRKRLGAILLALVSVAAGAGAMYLVSEWETVWAIAYRPFIASAILCGTAALVAWWRTPKFDYTIEDH
jgi:hypothetical protein